MYQRQTDYPCKNFHSPFILLIILSSLNTYVITAFRWQIIHTNAISLVKIWASKSWQMAGCIAVSFNVHRVMKFASRHSVPKIVHANWAKKRHHRICILVMSCIVAPPTITTFPLCSAQLLHSNWLIRCID